MENGNFVWPSTAGPCMDGRKGYLRTKLVGDYDGVIETYFSREVDGVADEVAC